jgi:acyl carrier protein
MDKSIRIGVYRIFRKLGIKRDEIFPEAFLRKNIFFDDQEWICFLFFIESHFDITLSKSDEEEIMTVESTIELIKAKKQSRLMKSRKIETYHQLV